MRADARLRLVEKIVRLEAMRKADHASDMFDRLRSDLDETVALAGATRASAAQADQMQTDLIRSAFMLNGLVAKADKASDNALDAVKQTLQAAGDAKRAEKSALDLKRESELAATRAIESEQSARHTTEKVVGIADALERKLSAERKTASEAKTEAEKTAEALKELLPVLKDLEVRDGWLIAIETSGDIRKIAKWPKGNGAFGGLGLLPQSASSGGTALTIREVTGNTAALATDDVIIVNNTATATVTLMALSDRTRPLHVKRIGTADVIVQPTSAVIDGDPYKTINRRWDSLEMIPASTRWVIL